MSPTEATRLLDLPLDATPEQLEARFLELRARLEDKIAKAPTPGLKAKYRESLEQITAAFESLTLAADGSALPVLQRQKTEDGGQKTASGPVSPRAGAPTPTAPASKKKSGGGKEFIIVALIAVAVLGAGGWWVVNTRAEKRLAAEAKAADDAKAAAAKAEQDHLAEVRHKADEEEKARVAAAAKAEQDRLEKLSAQLRGELAEYKVAWEVLEREEHNAERRLSELKSDARNVRDVPVNKVAELQALLLAQQDYYDWVSDTLARDPARVARSRADELLSAKQLDLAQVAVGELKAALGRLNEEIPKQRAARLAIEGSLAIRTEAQVAWTVTDAFGRVRTGKGSAQIDHVAFGPARVELTKALWPSRVETPLISRAQANEVVADFAGHDLNLASTPAGAEVVAADGRALGVTPLRLAGLPPGEHALTLRKEGYYDQKVAVTLPQAGADTPTTVTLRVMPQGLVRPERWIPPARLTMESRMHLVMDYSGSTGLYASSPSSTSDHADVEEWDFAQPDAQGRWQQMTRRIIRQDRPANIAQYAINGAALIYKRQTGDKWQGTFLKGTPSNETLVNVYTNNFPAKWLVSLDSANLWPAKETQVGGTWPVEPASLPGFSALTDITGKAEGKLLALERTPESESAEIEYSFSIEWGSADYRIRQVGTYRLQVNLREMFVSSSELHDRQSSRLAATPKDVMVTAGDSTYTVTYTKR